MTADDTVSDYEKGPRVADYGKRDDTVTATLAEWGALVEGATPPPWRYWNDGVVGFLPDPRGLGVNPSPSSREHTPGQALDDARFIAAARTAMPALLGFVREVQHILATQRHEVIGARGLREQDVVRARDIEQAARKWIGGEG